ncbi:hypothetical protein [Nostoc sp.]|uniref:hypothetical protein n=1 Tax=Nostoc sp. TaxID=1180 RepID=UPI002FFBFE6C
MLWIFNCLLTLRSLRLTGKDSCKRNIQRGEKLRVQPLTLRRYDLWVNAVVCCLFPLAGLWRSLIAGRLLSLPGLG